MKLFSCFYSNQDYNYLYYLFLQAVVYWQNGLFSIMFSPPDIFLSTKIRCPCQFLKTVHEVGCWPGFVTTKTSIEKARREGRNVNASRLYAMPRSRRPRPKCKYGSKNRNLPFLTRGASIWTTESFLIDTVSTHRSILSICGTNNSWKTYLIFKIAKIAKKLYSCLLNLKNRWFSITCYKSICYDVFSKWGQNSIRLLSRIISDYW